MLYHQTTMMIPIANAIFDGKLTFIIFIKKMLIEMKLKILFLKK